MGTRSTTYILDENSHVLVCLYAQYNGYIEGVGKNIADILSCKVSMPDDFKSTDLTPNGTEIDVLANNGMDCLAASLVKFMKEKPLGVYLYPMPRVVGLSFYVERAEVVSGLAEHARNNGSDYMYIIYLSKTTQLPNIMCYYLHESDMSAGVQYDGPAYELYGYLEEQKRKAEERNKAIAQDVAQPLEPISMPDGTAIPDIEFICNPEYD